MKGSRPVTWAEDAEIRRIIWAAREGNVQDLAHRLRQGLASREEMAFAANLIEGKIKSRHPRRGQPTRLTNDQIAQAFFQFKEAYPDLPRKKIVGKVVDMFGLSGRHVYNVVKALDQESRKRYELYARYVVFMSADNPTELPHFMGPRLPGGAGGGGGPSGGWCGCLLVLLPWLSCPIFTRAKLHESSSFHASVFKVEIRASQLRSVTARRISFTAENGSNGEQQCRQNNSASASPASLDTRTNGRPPNGSA
jgi:hypothetical protein